MPISKTAFIRSTIAAMLAGLAALLVIVGVNLWLVEQARVYANQSVATRLERSAIVDLRNLIDDAETSQRGYLLTSEEQYLTPYNEAERQIQEQIGRVRSRTEHDPVQRDAVTKLSQIIADKLVELHRTIDLVEAGRREEALAIVRTDRGRLLMEDARRLFASMVQRAEDNIARAVQKQRDAITALQWVTLGGAIVIVLVVGGAVWSVIAYTRQLLASQREIAELNIGLEERVRERTADLGRANEEIQRFAYIVTHDLRAPLVNIMGFTSELEACLNSIQGYVQQSGESTDPAAAEARSAALHDLPEAIGFIRSSTRKMDGLINAILKLSREGRRVLKPEPIELVPLLRTAAANVQHQVLEAGGEVVIEGEVPRIVSDRLALEQIFGNLLDNAVKYRSPARPLRIRIRAIRERAQRIAVEVADNGRGIAAQDHERVFELFRRSGSQDQAGEGLGLAHVRTMVRSLGGDIRLSSTLDRGTTMTLDLPTDLRRATELQKGAA
jgi:signal transduction histidine kinase